MGSVNYDFLGDTQSVFSALSDTTNIFFVLLRLEKTGLPDLIKQSYQAYINKAARLI